MNILMYGSSCEPHFMLIYRTSDDWRTCAIVGASLSSYLSDKFRSWLTPQQSQFPGLCYTGLDSILHSFLPRSSGVIFRFSFNRGLPRLCWIPGKFEIFIPPALHGVLLGPPECRVILDLHWAVSSWMPSNSWHTGLSFIPPALLPIFETGVPLVLLNAE